MKTGILNAQWLSNHGSVMIAYAMQKYLDSLKIENEIIDFKPQQPDEFGEIPSAHDDEKLSTKEKTAAFENFRRKFLRRSAPLIGTADADKLDYDLYIVGSDTVWTPIRIHDVEAEMFYFDFARGKNGRKISWSASIGAEDKKTLDEITPILKKRLENFDYISVRERETAAFVQTLTSKKVVHTMDPVLMLEKEDFLDIIPGVTKPGEDYIYAFLFNDLPGALDTVNELSKKTGLPVVANVKSIDRVNDLMLNCENDGPAEYVERILNAKYVISDSYHAVIFSILGKRPFICYTRPDTGIRARNLLEDLGLFDRFFYEDETGLDVLLKPIDYDAVYEKKKNWKVRSEEYLRTAMSGIMG